MDIQFSPPDIRQEDIDEVVATLKSGWITTGPRTKKFEENLSSFCNTKKTATFSSATTALESVLRLLKIGKGDEVITCAYTYTASASVVCHVGAKLVLADTIPNSFIIDPKDVAKKINKHTKAIIPVDIGGLPADYDELFSVVEDARRFFKPTSTFQKELGRIAIIADAAHSLGSIYKGKRSGSIADFSAFSFHAVKNLTTAEGGAITWNINNWQNNNCVKNSKTAECSYDNESIYRSFMLGSLHGQSKDAFSKLQKGSWEYDIIEPAYKCNMTDIQAALGLSQLKRYSKILQRRHEIIRYYNKAFSDLPVSSLEHFCENKTSSGHLYLLRLLGKSETERNQLINDLASLGIATNVHYKPLPLYTAYKKMGFSILNFPNSYNQYKNEITLPLNTCLKDEEVEYISQSVIKLIKKM
ncbi:MAG: capsular biosynthesis protein [Treponema sp. CETP13]|nr:MAG: capsular biosynthesis protein [Treponema sp. CETP13]